MSLYKRSISIVIIVAVFFAVFASAIFLLLKQGHKDGVPPEKLIIAISTALNSTLVKVSEAKGFLQYQNLDVTFLTFTSGKAALQSLLDGKADLATVAETPIMLAMMKGARLAILATIETSTKNEAIIARKDMGITSGQDLKGRKVGVCLGTSGDYYLDSYLIVEGMTRKDVEIVNLMPEDMTEALLQKKVTAVCVWNPIITNLQNVLGDNGTRLFNENIYTETFNVISTKGFPEQYPEAVRSLMRAFVQTEAFVAANPEESQQIMSQYSGIKGELLAGIWNDFRFNLSLNQSLFFTLEDQARWAIRSGLTERRDIPNFFEAFYFDGLLSVVPRLAR